MELSARKKQILKRVIEDYIASAEPVGSKAIAQEMGGSVSSATVRNELAELSDLGYLEQPHTSAGRVPSPKGYRLYVNELMERREVSEAEAEEINETLQDKMSAAGSMISQAGQMASSIVDYPAYAVAEGKSGVTVKRFELLGVDDTSFITVVMTDDSRVKSQLQRSPLAFDRARLTDLSALLNTHFTMQSREEMSAKLMGLSDQIAPELFLVLSATVGYAAEILEEAAKKDVFTTGASQILKMPEYRDLDKAHDLMTFFVDNKENLPVPEDDTPLKILIGPENVNEALRDTSVVVASYDIGGGMRAVPMADPFDGMLDICYVERVSIFKFICLLPKFIKGKHIKHKDIVHHIRTAEIKVSCPEACALQLDGEVDMTTPAVFRALPGALKVLLPADAT